MSGDTKVYNTRENKSTGVGVYALDSNKWTFKRTVTVLVAAISAVLTIIFTVLCMKNFKTGFLFEHAAVITSVAVSVEAICVVVAAVCLFKRFETVFKLFLTAFVIAAILLLALYVMQVTGLLDKIESIESLRKIIDSTGVWAPLVFILLQAMQVFLLPLPGVLTVGVGVALFGELETCLYSYIGILIGSVIAFWIGRVIGYRAAAWLVGKDSLDKWLEKVKGKDRTILTAMFILPLFPDDILCFVTGLSTMSWRYFIVMQLIARAISVVATSYSVGGSIIPYTTWWGILLWILIGAAIIALFIVLYKKGDKIEKWFFGLFKPKKSQRAIEENAADAKNVSDKADTAEQGILPAERTADTIVPEGTEGRNTEEKRKK